MSYGDNEFYRGVGDSEPTLKPEQPFDELSRGEEWQQGAGDSPTTAETEQLEVKDPESTRKGGIRKIAKMLKLTAAAIVTFAVATGSFGGGGIAGKISFNPTNEWPSVGYCTDEEEDDAYTTWYSTFGRQAHSVQFNVDGKGYRLEDSTGALTFLWSSSTADSAHLLVHDHYDGTSYSLDISSIPFPLDKREENNAYGTISSTTGDVFYIEAISHYDRKGGNRISTKDELADLMHQLVVRSHITAADPNGWGKVLIGDKLYSDIDLNWSGLDEYAIDYSASRISFDICYENYSTVKLTEFVGTVTVNEVEWSIYRQKNFKPDPSDDYGSDMVWYLPEVEGEYSVLGLRDHVLGQYFKDDKDPYSSVAFDNITDEMLLGTAEDILSHYHIAPEEWR